MSHRHVNMHHNVARSSLGSRVRAHPDR